MRIASRDLRNDTAGVLRRAAGGEVVQVTVNGEPVAELGRSGSNARTGHRGRRSPRA